MLASGPRISWDNFDLVSDPCLWIIFQVNVSKENVEEVAGVLVEILEGADMRKITNEEIQYVASILEDIVAIGNGSEQVCQLLHFIYIELV